MDECLNLEVNGIFINNEHYFFCISCIIADSPVRSHLKCVAPHNSRYGCEKCEQEGSFMGRMVWPYCKNLLLRNDASFKNQEYDDHQKCK